MSDIIKKTYSFCYHLEINYLSLSGARKVSLSEARDTVIMTFKYLDLYCEKFQFFKIKSVDYKDEEAFNLYQINIHFNSKSDFDESKCYLNNYIDYCMSQHEIGLLNGTQVTRNNYLEFFNKFTLACILEESLTLKNDSDLKKI